MQSKKKIVKFYKSLALELPDTRGKQGQKHSLPFVITGVILAIICGRSNRSEIERFIKNRFVFLKQVTKHPAHQPISYAQLTRILRGLDWLKLSELSYRFFGKEISQISDNEWVSFDGKDLRGSHQRNEQGEKAKRGETTVNAVLHEDKIVVGQTFFRGDKESEKIAVRHLLDQGFKSKSVTFDALHCDPTTLEMVNQNQGRYIVQVKENQAELLEELQQIPRLTKAKGVVESLEKGHGRIELRMGWLYDISWEYWDPRWNNCGLNSCMVIYRRFEEIRTGKIMEQTSFYITNVKCKSNNQLITNELFNAIRTHWSVENDNQVRDVTFKEDKSRAPTGNVCYGLAVLRTIGVTLIRLTGAKNLKAQLEKFSDKPNELARFLRKIRFT